MRTLQLLPTMQSLQVTLQRHSACSGKCSLAVISGLILLSTVKSTQLEEQHPMELPVTMEMFYISTTIAAPSYYFSTLNVASATEELNF